MAEGEHLYTEWECNDEVDITEVDTEENIEEDTDNAPEARLSRFLFLGKEYTNYQPGCWFVHDYFLIKNVPSIEQLASNKETELVPIDLITKVNNELHNTSQNICYNCS